ncbi:MAG TPA: MYXO-CTERM sorting domain-containing protein [Polyangiaceae bacterium]|nr:MYXO-CTERM sorting domain-containing protein [Polyangiaceae bacterium]
MNRRFSRSRFLVLSLNVGLVAGIGVLGCGEARQSDAAQNGEVPSGIVGTLHARLASYDDHAETYYRLVRDDGEEISLDFGANAPRARPGERIAVRGPRDGNRIEVDGYQVVRRGRDLNESQQALTAPAKRNFKIAAISLDTTVTAAKMKTRIFSDVDSPAAFYRDNSYGDWNMEGDVFGPYTVPIANCQEANLWNIAADAKAAAAADGLDPTKYDNFMYFVPASAGCSWGGIAEVGVNEVRGFINAVNSWYRGTGCVVLAQELGHNYGLLHSHKCSAPPYVAKSYGGTACAMFSEYGDPYTPMGGGCGHLNAPESAAQGFISGCNTLDVTTSGTFEVGPIEAKCAGPQVIRIANNVTANQGPQYVYVEYRKGMGSVGSDSKSPPGLYFHASAEYGGNHTDIFFDGGHDFDYALDPFYIHDPIATVDSTWTEPSSGATFKLTAIGPTATVEVTLPGTTPGAAKCMDGATPPAAPMCAMITTPDGGMDGGTPDAGQSDASDGGGMAGSGAAGMAGAAPEAGGGGATAGSGGSGGVTGGSGGSGGSDDGGCNCSIPGGNASNRAPLLLLGVAALLPALRRRRARRPN